VPHLWLNYFVMTDAERARGSYLPENTYPNSFYQLEDIIDITANDDRYSQLHCGCFEDIDLEKKILYYNVCFDGN